MLERFQQQRAGGSLKDVKWKYVLSVLTAQNVINAEEERCLLAIQDKSCQDGEVVRLLNARQAHELLAQALTKKGYRWIGDELKIYLNRDRDADRKLRKGLVPFKAAHEMERPELKEKLYNALKRATEAPDGRRWVVLHGMMGSGKTTLAAQTLRDPRVALDLFPRDICWLSLGKIENGKLLLKVQALCEHLDRSYNPTTMERCLSFLRNYFSNSGGQLLVLDDVHLASDILHMDLGIPILVTTKNLEVMPTSQTTGRTECINIGGGFSLEQSKTLMSNFMGVNINELPISCEEIHNKYEGSPLVMALVSGHMLGLKRPTAGAQFMNDQWKAVWQKLQAGQIGRTRMRHTSGTTSLKEAVKWTIDSLDDPELSAHFQDFALFWEDLYIPLKVFEVLWNMCEMDAFDILCRLENQSLVRRREEKVEASGSFSDSNYAFTFGVHDLLLDNLKAEDKTTKTERHTKLVDRYLEKFATTDNGTQNFGLLPLDGYIHMFLGYHLSRSNRTHLFQAIYFDLRFLQVKVEQAGYYDLLYDFKNYDRYFEDKQALKDFVRFISQNGSELSSRSNNYSTTFDLTQLALMEPSTSAVHKAAMKILPQILASGKNKRMYYLWCNQRNVRSSLLLSIRPHPQCAANYVAFSPRDQLVASAGQDCMLRLWDCCLGKEVLQYQEHESSVNVCCFSQCGSLIMSGSESGELKIWSVLDTQRFFPSNFKVPDPNSEDEIPKTPKPRGSFSFLTPSDSPNTTSNNSRCTPCATLEEDNQVSVTACTFSSSKDRNELLAASGYENGDIKIWNVCDELYVRTLSGHTARITALSFSGETLLASSSRDSYVILWDTRTGNNLKKLPHDGLVVCCQLSRSGDRVLTASGKYVLQWDLTLDENQKPKQYNGLKSSFWLNHCAYSPEENIIAGGTSDRSVVLWSSETGEVVATYKGLAEGIYCVSFSPDGRKLVSASSDGNVVLWGLPDHNTNNNNNRNLSSYSSRVSLTTHFDAVFLTNGTTAMPTVAVSDDSNHIQLISGLEGKLVFRSPKESEDISVCALSPSGGCLFYATDSGSLKVFRKQNKSETLGEAIQLPVNGCAKINICRFSTDGRWLVSCAEDGSIMRWPAESGPRTIPEQLFGHKSDIIFCRMYAGSDGDPRMLTCSSDGTMRTWSLETCQQLTSVSHNNENVTCGDVHVGRKVQVSSSVDGTMKMWHEDDGRNLGAFEFETCVRSCRLDSSGELVAGGDDNGTVLVFNIKTKICLHELKSHTSFVYDLHFSPDSKRLVSSGDGLRWWNLSTLNKKNSVQLQQSTTFHGGEIRTLFISPDFSVFVTVDNNGYLFILREMTTELLNSDSS